MLSVLAPLLREEMQLSASQYSYITAAFQLGMMAGQVPIGALLDRVGTRIGLAAIFVAWSVIGGAHALASGLAGFVVLRFLMGVSECGNYTAGIKAIAALFPAGNRASAGGLFNAGAQLGSIVATPLVVLIATQSRLAAGVSDSGAGRPAVADPVAGALPARARPSPGDFVPRTP